MREVRIFKYHVIIGWFVMALAIVAVALLILPEESRSSSFWYRVIWTELLSLLFWGSVSFYINVSTSGNDTIANFGGITPTIIIVTATYTILSFSVMIIHALLSQSDFINRAHWIIQIALFALAFICGLFLYISSAAANQGINYHGTNALTPKELHDLLAAHESLVRNPTFNELKASIKQLRETVIYSLNESASLIEMVEYKLLCSDIKSFCNSVYEYQKSNNDNADLSDKLTHSAMSLTLKTNMVSSKQIRN